MARASAVGAAGLLCAGLVAGCTSPGHGARTRSAASPALSGWRSTAEADVALRALSQPAANFPDTPTYYAGNTQTDELEAPEAAWCDAGLSPSDRLRIADRDETFTINKTQFLGQSATAYQGSGAELALTEMRTAPALCPTGMSPGPNGTVIDATLTLGRPPGSAPKGAIDVHMTQVIHPLGDPIAADAIAGYPAVAEFVAFRCGDVVISLAFFSTSNADRLAGTSYLNRALLHRTCA